MTLTAFDLVRQLNEAEHEVFAWYNDPDPITRRQRLEHARNMHRHVSAQEGLGTANPTLWSPQSAVVKLGHNAHITAWEQVVLYLAAANSSGIANLCPWSTPQCRKGCLGHTSGRMQQNNVQAAQRVRTHFLARYTADFCIVLIDETERHARRIHKCGKKMAARFNGTSEIPIEQCPWLLQALRDAGADMFFDYAKGVRTNSKRRRHIQSIGMDGQPVAVGPDGPIADYYLAPSATERTHPDDVQGGDVVIVDTKRNHPLPDTWAGLDVIDGDHDNGDLRFLDDHTKVVLLRAKGALYGDRGATDSFVKPSNVPVKIGVGSTP